MNEIIELIDSMIEDLNTIKSHVNKEEFKQAREYSDGIASDAEYLCDLVENNE